MARRSGAQRSPTSGAGGGGGADGAPGSVRARLRLGAAAMLGLLAVLYLVLAVRLYFHPFVSAAASVVAVVFGVGALVHGLLMRAVVKQSRGGHILAAVVCLVGAVLSLSVAMAWPDWATLLVNVSGLGLLLGCVPRRATPVS